MNAAECRIDISPDEELIEQLDDLVAAAAAGDERAVGAIAFGPTLLAEARAKGVVVGGVAHGFAVLPTNLDS